VDDDNSNLLVAQLLYLDSIGKKDITMYVNSPGGSVTAGQSTLKQPLSHLHMQGIMMSVVAILQVLPCLTVTSPMNQTILCLWRVNL